MFDIIIPIYRIEPHILRLCLESIINQENNDYKIYIVDGSPETWEHQEEVLALINEYHTSHYIRQSGNGLAQARNQAIAEGSNPYVALLDGDDFWYPHHLSEIANAIAESTKDTVVWWDSAVYPIKMHSARNRGVDTAFIQQYLYEDMELYDDLTEILTDYLIIPSTSVIKRDRIEDIGGFNEDLHYREDVDFFWRLSKTAYKGKFVNQFGCIALLSEDTRKKEGWGDKMKDYWHTFIVNNADYNFNESQRFNLVWGEPHPSQEVMDLCFQLYDFDERNALNRLQNE